MPDGQLGQRPGNLRIVSADEQSVTFMAREGKRVGGKAKASSDHAEYLPGLTLTVGYQIYSF